MRKARNFVPMVLDNSPGGQYTARRSRSDGGVDGARQAGEVCLP